MAEAKSGAESLNKLLEEKESQVKGLTKDKEELKQEKIELKEKIKELEKKVEVAQKNAQVEVSPYSKQ